MEGRYVQIVKHSNERIALSEIEIDFAFVISSSSHDSVNLPAHMRDNLISTHVQTLNESNPWVQIDFGTTQTIDSITFVIPPSSRDNFTQIEIRVGDIPLTGSSGTLFTENDLFARFNGPLSIANVVGPLSAGPSGLSGRYMTIQSDTSNLPDGTNELAISEAIIVFGKYI